MAARRLVQSTHPAAHNALRLADALEVSIFDLLEELPGDTEKGAEE